MTLKKNQQWVEKWFDRIAALFDNKRREKIKHVPDENKVEELSKLQQSFNDQNAFNEFLLKFKISQREWEIITLVCDGFTNNEIEEKLFLSLATVKDYIHKIFQKTGVKNRVQLNNFIRNTIDEINK